MIPWHISSISFLHLDFDLFGHLLLNTVSTELHWFQNWNLVKRLSRNHWLRRSTLLMKVEAGNSAAYVCLLSQQLSWQIFISVTLGTYYVIKNSSFYCVSTCIQIVQYVQYVHALQTHPGVLIRLFIGLYLWFSFTVWMVVPRRLDSGSKKEHLV